MRLMIGSLSVFNLAEEWVVMNLVKTHFIF